MQQSVRNMNDITHVMVESVCTLALCQTNSEIRVVVMCTYSGSLVHMQPTIRLCSGGIS